MPSGRWPAKAAGRIRNGFVKGDQQLPLYEFACESCGHRFEALLPFSRKAEARCPECGSDTVKELLSGFASPGSGSGSSGFNTGGGSGFT